MRCLFASMEATLKRGMSEERWTDLESKDLHTIQRETQSLHLEQTYLEWFCTLQDTILPCAYSAFNFIQSWIKTVLYYLLYFQGYTQMYPQRIPPNLGHKTLWWGSSIPAVSGEFKRVYLSTDILNPVFWLLETCYRMRRVPLKLVQMCFSIIKLAGCSVL